MGTLWGLNCVGKLYRDDGLLATSASRKQNEKLKQDIIKIYEEEGLRLTIHPNKKIVHFLDITLNLEDGSYEPYLKDGNIPLYINAKSNHPPAVIKAVPLGINRRLCKISSSKDAFERTKGPYQQALLDSGFKHTLEYSEEDGSTQPSRRRSRKIIYWIPPFTLNVSTNLGEKFLNLVNKCFPKGSVLCKAFNRNNLKLSYRTMPNIAQKITSHNRGILERSNGGNSINEGTPSSNCNCRDRANCPMEGNCLTSSLVYKATVNQETYIGMTGGQFKTRYNSHKASFRHRNKESETTLSKYIWSEKDKGNDPEIKWECVTVAPTYTPGLGRCILCLREKEKILYYRKESTLNSRMEITNTCRHRRKFILY